MLNDMIKKNVKYIVKGTQTEQNFLKKHVMRMQIAISTKLSLF